MSCEEKSCKLYFHDGPEATADVLVSMPTPKRMNGNFVEDDDYDEEDPEEWVDSQSSVNILDFGDDFISTIEEMRASLVSWSPVAATTYLSEEDQRRIFNPNSVDDNDLFNMSPTVEPYPWQFHSSNYNDEGLSISA